MSLKSTLIALAGNVGKCQENARSLKLELERGLLEVADSTSGKIWTNEAPTTAMDEGDITITDSDSFDGYYIIYRPLSSNTNNVIFIDKSAINDDNTYEIHHTYVSSGQVYNARRTVKLTKAEGSSDVKFTFSKGTTRHIDPYGTASSFTANNNVIIPAYIVGVKF